MQGAPLEPSRFADLLTNQLSTGDASRDPPVSAPSNGLQERKLRGYEGGYPSTSSTNVTPPMGAPARNEETHEGVSAGAGNPPPQVPSVLPSVGASAAPRLPPQVPSVLPSVGASAAPRLPPQVPSVLPSVGASAAIEPPLDAPVNPAADFAVDDIGIDTTTLPMDTFAPLPANMPTDSQLLSTLAPTTPADTTISTDSSGYTSARTDSTPSEFSQSESEISPAIGDSPVSISAEPPASEPTRVSRVSPDGDEIQQNPDRDRGVPFGLVGLASAFPMGTSQDQLLNKYQVESELKQMGLHPNHVRNGLQYGKDGGGLYIHREDAYRVQHLNKQCVAALRKKGRKSTALYTSACKALVQSQEISNLNATLRAIAELRASGLIDCAPTAALSAQLEVLSKACREWVERRSRVAHLMHQVKAREGQIDDVQRQLATLQDVLAQDKEAVKRASAAEFKLQTKKKPYIMNLVRDTHNTVSRIQQMADAK